MKSATTPKLLFLLVFMLTFVSIYGQEKGEAIFSSKCSICHTIGGGKLVGPDLAGVTGKYETDWLKSFIQSSQSLVNAGDPQAVAIYNEFNKTIMPDQPLNESEIASVLAYISASGQSAGGVAVKPQELPEGNSENGEKLFFGHSRLEERGATCISCHNVNWQEEMSGGAFAKDLSESFSNLGEAGVAGILGNPPFPAMKEAYDDAPLSPQEVADLTAFLGKVSENQAVASASPINHGKKLLYGGAIAVTVLLASFSLFWMKRKRFTVNRRIYDRQIKSHS